MKFNEVFFDNNADFYGNQQFNKADLFFLKFIDRLDYNNKKILDIGGGSGVLSQMLLARYNDIDISIVDPSEKMLVKIADHRIKKFKGHLPGSLNIISSEKFDYIFLKEVLHHLTNKKIGYSKEIVVESLNNIKEHLNDDGHLFIHEIFYESYILPHLTRTAIFYLLKFQNAIKIQFLPKEFLIGLNVYFFSRTELKKIISITDFHIVDMIEINFSNTIRKKCLFLKDWGRILLIVKKGKKD